MAETVGIAGIMGGENSMITDNVHTVLFEADASMVQISVFLQSESEAGTDAPVNSKKVLIRTMPKQQSTVHASLWKNWEPVKL